MWRVDKGYQPSLTHSFLPFRERPTYGGSCGLATKVGDVKDSMEESNPLCAPKGKEAKWVLTFRSTYSKIS